MKRLFQAVAFLALALSTLALPAGAQTVSTAINSTVFPLSASTLFPARTQRVALKCQNDAANAAVTITYPSGFVIVLAAGGTLWEVPSTGLPGRVPNGVILATGTAGQTIRCEDTYLP